MAIIPACICFAVSWFMFLIQQLVKPWIANIQWNYGVQFFFVKTMPSKLYNFFYFEKLKTVSCSNYHNHTNSESGL